MEEDDARSREEEEERVVVIVIVGAKRRSTARRSKEVGRGGFSWNANVGLVAIAVATIMDAMMVLEGAKSFIVKMNDDKSKMTETNDVRTYSPQKL